MERKPQRMLWPVLFQGECEFFSYLQSINSSHISKELFTRFSPAFFSLLPPVSQKILAFPCSRPLNPRTKVSQRKKTKETIKSSGLPHWGWGTFILSSPGIVAIQDSSSPLVQSKIQRGLFMLSSHFRNSCFSWKKKGALQTVWTWLQHSNLKRKASDIPFDLSD